MGKSNSREYRVWDTAEEAALRAGVKKHGLGAWERIRTDAEFNILLHRTGVQLKDKWRNLVKFRHITPDETLALQPKTSGPWHKKYSAAVAAASAGQRLSGGGGAAEGAEPEAPAAAAPSAAASAGAAGSAGTAGRARQRQPAAMTDTDEDELPATELEDDLPKRKSSRSVKRRNFVELEDVAEDDDSWEIGCESESRGPGGRKRQRSSGTGGAAGLGPNEDRRFGIYDRRRYGHSGQGREGLPGDGGNHVQHENHYDPVGPHQGRRGTHRPDSASVSDDTEFEDTYIVECACGIQFDDGNLMIECEHCKAWAHTACLQKQMVSFDRVVRA
eukprot:gene3914-4168_t